MKTQLFLGVLVAVISWSSALSCWGSTRENYACWFPGKKLDKLKTKCIKIDCASPSPLCARITTVGWNGKITTGLTCGKGWNGACFKVPKLSQGGNKTTACVCDTELCNEVDIEPKPKPEPPTENGAQAGTSYTHLIIAFIVGTIFLH